MIVRVRPEEIPAFFKKSADRLRKECYILAEDGHNTQIRLSAAGANPCVRAFNCGFLVSSFSTNDDKTLVEKASAMYDMFLGSGWNAKSSGERPSATFEDLDGAYERDDALRLAFYDFLCTVVEDEELIYDGEYDQEFEDMLDEVLQKVADLGLPVRRPTTVENEDGTYTIVDFPYGSDD